MAGNGAAMAEDLCRDLGSICAKGVQGSLTMNDVVKVAEEFSDLTNAVIGGSVSLTELRQGVMNATQSSAGRTV